MAIKKAEKTIKKKTVAKPAEKKEEKVSGKYFYSIGKRKTSVAQVRIYPVKKEKSEVSVNDRKFDAYFTIEKLQGAVLAPLVLTGQEGKFDVVAKVMGGGTTGQAEAIRLGVARALVKFDNSLKKSLKDLGFLTRDARKVERKKPGFRKARRSPQWAKR